MPTEADVKLTWRHEETLYSLLSRHHFLSGHLRPEETSFEVFGRHRLDLAHDLPSHVDLLTSRTRGTLGEATSLIFERTLLPYFLPFRTASQAHSGVLALRAGSVGSGKMALGIRHPSLCVSNPLKACQKCLIEDTDEYYLAHWHRDHQWPGAVICLHHNEPLLYGTGRAYVGSRFDWLLPHDLEFTACSDISRTGAWLFLKRLTACACALGKMPEGFHFAPRVLSLTYRQRLTEMDLAQPNGRLYDQKFSRYISVACSYLMGVPGFKILFQGSQVKRRRFENILSPCRPTTHPVLHLILISTMFESWDDFARSYASECLGLEDASAE